MSWELNRVGDICKVKSGKRLPKGMSVQDEPTTRKYLRVTDLKSHEVDESDIKYISEDIFKLISRYTISCDDIYISIAGTIGKVGIIPASIDGISLTENCCKLTELNKSKIIQHFLLHYLKSYEGQSKMQAKTGGASQPKLAITRLKDILIPTPPIQTQKRIADILSAYDDLIENNLKRIKLLEQAAQNIYKEWFVNLRFPGYENTTINEETGLPEGWVKSPFNDVSVNNNRKRIPVNGTERSKRQGAYRYYGATGVMDYIDDYIFDGRFLLVAEDGTVYDKKGNAYTQLVEGKFWVNNHAHIISAGNLPVEYLYLAMKHYPIGHLITGAVQLKLSMKNLKSVGVINPSEDILKKFISIVNPMINQVFTLNTQTQKLKAARDILLPRLMNRTIEV